MKRLNGLLLAIILFSQRAVAQDVLSPEALTGVYRLEEDTSQEVTIKAEKRQLILALSRGQTVLRPLGGNLYKPEQVQPVTTITFVKDSSGKAGRFLWTQEVKTELVKQANTGEPGQYAGSYQIRNNPYVKVDIVEKDSLLMIHQDKGNVIPMHRIAADVYVYEKGDFRLQYSFERRKDKQIESIRVHRQGPLTFTRIDEKTSAYLGQSFTADKVFNRADSLIGQLTPARSYDVLFYDLSVRVMPESSSLTGSNMIRFRTTEPLPQLQVDLFGNMHIDSIVYHGQVLHYSREFSAVLVSLPAMIPAGVVDSLTVYYGGSPRQPNLSQLQGGFFWLQDKDGNPWIESVCQGSGASLWWPCKDHLSDEPDSMRIAVIVPDTLMNVSNGSLQGVEELPGHLKRYNWFVHYPINNYNVALNIGKYAHYTESLARGGDSLLIHYYYLAYHDSIARYVFRNTRRMLAAYEQAFGPYPFFKDGFTYIESPYPMEHQGAVSTGAFSTKLDADVYDTAEVMRVAWHEAAHEWWGNHVSCADFADIWLHEAFATYGEVMCYDLFQGPEAMKRYLKDQHPSNRHAIIGTYGVNDFHLEDVYSKGVLVVHMLRQMIGNDSLWFSLLHQIQEQLSKRPIHTKELETLIGEVTGKDLRPFFDQYLRQPALPELAIKLKQRGSATELSYCWKAAVSGFNMPVKVRDGKGSFSFIYPTAEWQRLILPDCKPKELTVDTVNYLMTVKKE